MWARGSPHPALAENRRVRPTRIAPIALFLREDACWLMPAAPVPDPTALSHPAREVLAALSQQGASFFSDIVRHTAGWRAKSRTGYGNSWPGVWSPPMDSIICAPWSIPNGGAAKGARDRNVRVTLPAAGLCCAILARPPERRAPRAFRPAIASPLGRFIARPADPRNARSAMARPAPGFAQIGSARRNSWRPLRFRLYRRTIRAARSSRLLRSLRRDPERNPAIAVANTDPLNLAGIILPGPRVSRLAIAGLVPA